MSARTAAGRVAFALVGGVLTLAAPPWAPAQATPPWRTDDITVVQSTPGVAGETTTRFEVADNGDARVTAAIGNGKTHTSGTILLVGGRWLLARGFTPARRAVEALDAATLNSQLAILLLNAALPHGPPRPGLEAPVSVSERSNPIRISTPTATGVYEAPWSVAGSVTVARLGAPAEFKLTFTYRASGEAATRLLAGSLGAASPPLSLPDSMPLAGWTIRRINTATTDAAASGAKPADTLPVAHPKVVTLGELRLE